MKKKQPSSKSSFYAGLAVFISSAFTIYIVYNLMTLGEGTKTKASKEEKSSTREQKNSNILSSTNLGTIRIFNPDYSKAALEDELLAYARMRLPDDPENLYKAYYKEKVESFIYDINEISLNGWEIKDSRRAWIDLDGDGNSDSFEWGTEFILQK